TSHRAQEVGAVAENFLAFDDRENAANRLVPFGANERENLLRVIIREARIESRYVDVGTAQRELRIVHESAEERRHAIELIEPFDPVRRDQRLERFAEAKPSRDAVPALVP